MPSYNTLWLHSSNHEPDKDHRHGLGHPLHCRSESWPCVPHESIEQDDGSCDNRTSSPYSCRCHRSHRILLAAWLTILRQAQFGPCISWYTGERTQHLGDPGRCRHRSLDRRRQRDRSNHHCWPYRHGEPQCQTSTRRAAPARSSPALTVCCPSPAIRHREFRCWALTNTNSKPVSALPRITRLMHHKFRVEAREQRAQALGQAILFGQA